MHLLRNKFPFWMVNQVPNGHRSAKLFFNKYYAPATLIVGVKTDVFSAYQTTGRVVLISLTMGTACDSFLPRTHSHFRKTRYLSNTASIALFPPISSVRSLNELALGNDHMPQTHSPNLNSIRFQERITSWIRTATSRPWRGVKPISFMVKLSLIVSH